MAAHLFLKVARQGRTYRFLLTFLVNKVTKALTFHNIERPIIQSTHDNKGIVTFTLLMVSEKSIVAHSPLPRNTCAWGQESHEVRCYVAMVYTGKCACRRTRRRFGVLALRDGSSSSSTTTTTTTTTTITTNTLPFIIYFAVVTPQMTMEVAIALTFRDFSDTFFSPTLLSS